MISKLIINMLIISLLTIMFPDFFCAGNVERSLLCAKRTSRMLEV